jgi:hypothetical protein
MGRAGRFAAAERETKTTRRWPGPDAYEAIGSLGAQPVSRRDTLPRIAFTRARRAVGNVSRRGSEDEEDAYHHGDNAVGPGSYANASGMGRQAVSGRITAPARRFPKDGRWRDGGGGGGGGGAYGAASSGRLYDSVGDQALSYHPNAPYVHFGTSFRERAGLVSLSKKQAKKAMCGKLGPGPAYPPGLRRSGNRCTPVRPPRRPSGSPGTRGWTTRVSTTPRKSQGRGRTGCDDESVKKRRNVSPFGARLSRMRFDYRAFAAFKTSSLDYARDALAHPLSPPR